jgi:magnesium-transporting ATPase (P-type)
MLLTVCLQFALHFLGLVFLVREAHVLQAANSTGTLNQHALSFSNLLSGKPGFALLPNSSHSMPHILDEEELGAVSADAAHTFLPLGDDLTHVNVLNSSLPTLNATGAIGGNATVNVTSVMERHFQPNLVNSVVYLVSVATQVITFAVNYKGYPFMESLIENRPLFYSLVLSGSAFVALTLQHEPFDEFARSLAYRCSLAT